MTMNEIVSGAWDTHVHAGPDISDRKYDALAFSRSTFEAGAIFDAIQTGIEATGPEHNPLAPDYGQPGRPSPPAALAMFHERLRDAGVLQSALERMARDTPAAVFRGN